jgi:predicted Zn-dependent protease with MMP-like domain
LRKRTGTSWAPIVSAQARRRRHFEGLVADALDALPEEFRSRLSNIEIVVEDRPDRESLLGLYHGVPQTSRSSGYAGALPDLITIYRLPLEAGARTPDELAEHVRRTVWHEIAHHFGISDERLRELGWS